MSAPMIDYAERDPDDPDHLDHEFVFEHLERMVGTWDRVCPTCRRLTPHCAWTDEHGCEFASGCSVCFRITRYHGCAYAQSKERAS